jgi:hypothetical protein
VRPEPKTQPAPASWAEALDLVRLENPTMSEPKVFSLAAERFPDLRRAQIVHKARSIRDMR